MNKYPTKKSYFIWDITKCSGGDPGFITQAAKDIGLSWVAIKYTDGAAPFCPFGYDAKKYKILLEQTSIQLKEQGIQVYGWGYTYGKSNTYAISEAKAASEAIAHYPLDGWLIDAESQYKVPSGKAWANQYGGYLRSANPELPIGLCSYRFPVYHPEFPWNEFLKYCDFHAPQVYWEGAHNPGVQLQRSVKELRALKDLPIIPVGSVYAAGGWEPTVADLNLFDYTCRIMALPGVSWWSWQHAQARAEWWEAIKAQDWLGNVIQDPTPTPVITLEERVTMLERKALTHGW
jgi:hypothetical protein